MHENKATPEEIAKVQEQLSKTCNDPNFILTTCTCERSNEKYANGNKGICKDCPIDAKK